MHSCLTQFLLFLFSFSEPLTESDIAMHIVEASRDGKFDDFGGVDEDSIKIKINPGAVRYLMLYIFLYDFMIFLQLNQ